MGQLLPVVTISEFSCLATCYAVSHGRDRPEANYPDVRIKRPNHLILYNEILRKLSLR